MSLVEHDPAPLDLVQQALTLLLLPLVELGLLVDRNVILDGELERKRLADSSARSASGDDVLGSDDNVVLAQHLFVNVPSLAVVEMPTKSLAADVRVELIGPVRSDGERTHCSARSASTRWDGREGHTDEGHVVETVVRFLGRIDHSLPRVVCHNERDRLHRLAQSYLPSDK